MKLNRSRRLSLIAFMCLGLNHSVAGNKTLAELLGVWNYTSMTALKNGKPFGTVNFEPGQWTMTLNADQTWTMKTPSRINPQGLKGTYEVHGHDLDMKLANGKPYSKYRFTLEQDGKVLVLNDTETKVSARRE